MKLRNTYYALRHGTSIANERGIVVSHPDNGVCGWGLSVAGRYECRRRFALGNEGATVALPPTTCVVTSDFARAVETAALLCEGRGLRPFEIDPGLRERCFGELELGAASRYGEVWERDAFGPDHGYANAESTTSVAQRMLAVMNRFEAAQVGATVVLVSHGDPLQVLEAVLAGLPSHRHRERPHLGNAELRLLQQGCAASAPTDRVAR